MEPPEPLVADDNHSSSEETVQQPAVSVVEEQQSTTESASTLPEANLVTQEVLSVNNTATARVTSASVNAPLVDPAPFWRQAAGPFIPPPPQPANVSAERQAPLPAATATDNTRVEHNNNVIPGPQHPLFNVRDRLFHALFYRMATVYARAVPPPFRTALECCALIKVNILMIYIYFIFDFQKKY